MKRRMSKFTTRRLAMRTGAPVASTPPIEPAAPPAVTPDELTDAELEALTAPPATVAADGRDHVD